MIQAPKITFSRKWAMPNANTFSIPPIKSLVEYYFSNYPESADPFARNCLSAKYTNDINLKTQAEFHMDAEDFLYLLYKKGIRVDLLLLDPPYSPRQVSENYKSAGLPVTMQDTQNARLYKRVRDAGDRILNPGGFVLSFGWNSGGMGISRGYEIRSIMLVCHGGAHNDTICLVEQKY